MPLIINQDGKLERVIYSAYDRLLLALKSAKRRNEHMIETLAAERATPRKTK